MGGVVSALTGGLIGGGKKAKAASAPRKDATEPVPKAVDTSRSDAAADEKRRGARRQRIAQQRQIRRAGLSTNQSDPPTRGGISISG